MNEEIQAVAAMTSEDLCALAGRLGQTYVENEPSGELLGICLVEQAGRFARMIAAARSGQDVPTTNGRENK